MKKIIFSPHAGIRLKERKIPKDVARNVAQYGHVVRESRLGQFREVIKRGQVGNRPLHVIMVNNVVKTAYWATEWNCNVRLRRTKG